MTPKIIYLIVNDEATDGSSEEFFDQYHKFEEAVKEAGPEKEVFEANLKSLGFFSTELKFKKIKRPKPKKGVAQ